MPTSLKPYTLLAALVALNAAGQTLSKEITVDKDVVPQEREASRMVLTPKLVLPAIQQKSLKWTDRGVVAPVSPTVAVLPPAAYASSVEPSPYRGYVMAGYFPTFQLGVSAGYKIVNKQKTGLNAWLQYDGSSVKRTAPYGTSGDKITYNTEDVRVGLDGSHTFGDIGTLSGRASYGFSSFNFPTLVSKGFTQKVNRADVDLGWQSQLGAFDYSIGLGYSYFGFTKGKEALMELSSRNENVFSLALAGRYALSESWTVGADVDFNYMGMSDCTGRFAGHQEPSEPLTWVDMTAKEIWYEEVKSFARDYSITEMHPFVRWKNDNFAVKTGVGIQIAGGDCGSNRVRPDLRIDWTPSSFFGLWAQLNDRRVDMQTLSARYDRNRYMSKLSTSCPLLDKWHMEGGIIVGPFQGASVEVWGGVGTVSSYFAPAIWIVDYGKEDKTVWPLYHVMGDYTGIAGFRDVHYGAALNYDYRDVASLRVSWEGAPQEYDEGNISAIDRARSVFDVRLGVHPIKPLDVWASYTVRSGRCLYSVEPANPDIFLPFEYKKISLGNAASLDLGATWRFSDRFNVWLTVENLLNRKWQIVYGIPNKGITGLAGVSFRF